MALNQFFYYQRYLTAANSFLQNLRTTILETGFLGRSLIAKATFQTNPVCLCNSCITQQPDPTNLLAWKLLAIQYKLGLIVSR